MAETPSTSGNDDASALREHIKQLEEELNNLRSIKTDAIVLQSENFSLTAQVEKLQGEIATLRSADGHPVFLFSWISQKDDLVSHFCGLPNAKVFNAILAMFDGVELSYFKNWKVTRLARTEQFFLTLLKLRRGLTNEDLAVRFCRRIHSH